MEFIGWFIVIILLKFILIDLDGISLKDLFYNPNKSNDKGKQKQTKEEKLYIEYMREIIGNIKQEINPLIAQLAVHIRLALAS